MDRPTSLATELAELKKTALGNPAISSKASEALSRLKALRERGFLMPPKYQGVVANSPPRKCRVIWRS